MLRSVRFLLGTYLWTTFVFIFGKALFMLYCQDEHPFSFADLFQVVAHGLTLDLSTSLYILAVPLLLVMADVWWSGKWVAAALHVFFALASLAISLSLVADASLYPFWGFKLDASCLQYLATPTEAMASVSTGYLLLRLVAFLLLAAAVFGGYLRQVRAYCAPREGKSADSKSVKTKSVATLFYLLCLPLMVVGIRGGLDESTTNVGQVYFSQNQYLNHAAVNPVFSFVASLESTASESVAYSFYDEAELHRLTAGLYDSEAMAGDTLLTTQRPNVVVILLESCGKMFLPVMPNLQQAAEEGIDFTRCYGNSYRTDRGTVSALSGYLSFPTMSVMKMSNKVAHLPAIARSLQREGYTTEYLYGGDINFTKMKGYLVSTGFERLHWKKDYTQQEQSTSKWGVRDDITFETLGQMVLSHDGSRPFLIGYSTLSSHEPWDVPVSKYEEKQYNGFYYVDQCIGRFLRQMKASSQWDNLLIVFLPDHSSDFHEYTEQHPDRNLIPMIWTGGAVKRPRKLDMICNQSDLAATLLGQMGIAHADFAFSRDVTSRSYSYPFAVHAFNNGLSMTDSTGFMLYDLSADRIMVSTSAAAERMSKTAKAILQLASEDLTRIGR